MKTIRITLPDTAVDQLIDRTANEVLTISGNASVVRQFTETAAPFIREMQARAEAVTDPRTCMQIDRSFDLESVRLDVKLRLPRKVSMLDRVKNAIRGSSRREQLQ
jgi:hypothetical protein